MITYLDNIISPEQLATITSFMKQQQFKDGKLTANSLATPVKNNQELIQPENPRLNSINSIIMNCLINHPQFKAAAMMKKLGAPIYARYHQGMYYGSHIDNPIMGQHGQFYRTDISMTLFLNDPDLYEGGELVIQSPTGEHFIKRPAGSAVIYPSTNWHRVNEVKSGERLVCLTWIQSMVKDPQQREVLYNLYKTNESLLKKENCEEESQQLNASYTKLIQMWSDV